MIELCSKENEAEYSLQFIEKICKSLLQKTFTNVQHIGYYRSALELCWMLKVWRITLISVPCVIIMYFANVSIMFN